jgi:gamma-glutamylputrescine oxidase
MMSVSAERMDTPNDTFYAATAVPHSARPRLTLEIDTNVCIVGAGLAGLWVARALVRRGYEVVVLEAGRVAGGASGRNGGFCSAGFSQELSTIIERVGLDHARALYKLSREGVEHVRALLAEGTLGLDPTPGRLNVLRYSGEDELKREAELLAEKFDHDVLVWPTERVREALKTECYYQALHDADALNLHPLNLALALAADIEKGGGRIYEESPVVAADLDGVRKWVATKTARVRAHQIVFCGSAAIGPWFPELARCIIPVGTHIGVTEPLGERLGEAIRYNGGVSDTRRAFDYYRVIGDRLMWGGYITTRTKRPRRLPRMLTRDILNVYPQLEGVKIESAWTGTMGYAVHRMPQIGLLRPGVWIASAFGGQGINTTAMAGDLVASAIAENDDRWRLFIPFGLVWAGGVLGRATAQVMYWGAALRDRFDEWQARRAEERRRDEAGRAAENERLARLAAQAEAVKPMAAHTRKKARATKAK